MSNSQIPHLTGGILYCLLLESRKNRVSKRKNVAGIKDGLSDTDVFIGLSLIVSPDYSQPLGRTLNKIVSNYKKCLKISSDTPLTDPSLIGIFHGKFQQKNSDIYLRMSEFVDKFIMKSKYELLAKFIIDTIRQDIDIPENATFDISPNDSVLKKDLQKVSAINLDVFLVSVLDYVLVHNQDNKKGQATFKKWHDQDKENAPWFFTNHNLGKAISQNISITRFEFEDEENTSDDIQSEYSNISTLYDNPSSRSKEEKVNQSINDSAIYNIVQNGNNNNVINNSGNITINIGGDKDD